MDLAVAITHTERVRCIVGKFGALFEEDWKLHQSETNTIQYEISVMPGCLTAAKYEWWT
jgi:hypothetical protein